jgi:hypothetical protein
VNVGRSFEGLLLQVCTELKETQTLEVFAGCRKGGMQRVFFFF